MTFFGNPTKKYSSITNSNNYSSAILARVYVDYYTICTWGLQDWMKAHFPIVISNFFNVNEFVLKQNFTSRLSFCCKFDNICVLFVAQLRDIRRGH